MSDRVGYWQRMVVSLEASGLSRAECCRRRRLNYHTLTYWGKRLGHPDEGGAGAGLGSFVEVSWAGVTGPAAEEVLRVLPAGLRSRKSDGCGAVS